MSKKPLDTCFRSGVLSGGDRAVRRRRAGSHRPTDLCEYPMRSHNWNTAEYTSTKRKRVDQPLTPSPSPQGARGAMEKIYVSTLREVPIETSPNIQAATANEWTTPLTPSPSPKGSY